MVNFINLCFNYSVSNTQVNITFEDFFPFGLSGATGPARKQKGLPLGPVPVGRRSPCQGHCNPVRKGGMRCLGGCRPVSCAWRAANSRPYLQEPKEIRSHESLHHFHGDSQSARGGSSRVARRCRQKRPRGGGRELASHGQ